MSTYTDRYNTQEKLEKRREYMKEEMKARRQNDKQYFRDKERKYTLSLKTRVEEYLGGSVCCECGCDISEILEVNHINGGGSQETKNYKGGHRQFLRDILNGKLKKEDYNILCKVCNVKHYVEQIKGIKGHTVTWDGKKS